MKTSQQIKDEIVSLEREYKFNKPELSDSSVKKYQKKLSFLKTCQLYIQSNPDIEFLNKEKRKLESKLVTIDNNFGSWCSANFRSENDDKALSDYLKSMGVKDIKVKIETIDYLLGN